MRVLSRIRLSLLVFFLALAPAANAAFLPYGIKQLVFSYQDQIDGELQTLNYVVHEHEVSQKKYYGVMFYLGDEDLSARPDNTRLVKILPESTVWNLSELVLRFTDPDLSFTENSFSTSCGEFGKAFKLAVYNWRIGIDPPFYSKKISLNCAGASQEFVQVRQAVENAYWASEESLFTLQSRYYRLKGIEDVFKAFEKRKTKNASEGSIRTGNESEKYAGKILYAVTHDSNRLPEVQLKSVKESVNLVDKIMANDFSKTLASSRPYETDFAPGQPAEYMPTTEYSGYIQAIHGNQKDLQPIYFNHELVADASRPYEATIRMDFAGEHFNSSSKDGDHLQIRLGENKNEYVVRLRNDHYLHLKYLPEVLLPHKGNGSIRFFGGRLYKSKNGIFKAVGKVALFDNKVFEGQAPDRKNFEDLFSAWSN